MKKLLLALVALLVFLPFLNTRADEPNIGYYDIRYQIACRNYEETDARCFWKKVEFFHAKDVLNNNDADDNLTSDEINRINKKIGFLKTRYSNFCEGVEETSYFCPALGKLVKKGQHFVNKTMGQVEVIVTVK